MRNDNNNEKMHNNLLLQSCDHYSNSHNSRCVEENSMCNDVCN